MSIIKNRAPRFVSVPSETVRDPELSGEALGLLVFLLDFPADWDVSVQWIVKQKRFGSNGKVVGTLKDLRTLGYARLTKRKNGTTEWDITSIKGTFTPATSSSVNPNSQNRNEAMCPDSEKPNYGNPNLGFRNASTEGISTDSTTTEPPPSPTRTHAHEDNPLADMAPILDRSINASILLRKLGVTITGMNPDLVVLAREGITDEELREAVDRSRLNPKFSGGEQIPAGWLVKVAGDVLKERTRRNEKPPVPRQQQPGESVTNNQTVRGNYGKSKFSGPSREIMDNDVGFEALG